MMKKLLLSLVFVCLAVAAFSTPAFAFSLVMDGSSYNGPVIFKYNNWDYGTIYQPGTSFDNLGTGSGATNSYGVFQVTSIMGQTSGGTWVDVWTPTTSEALEGWFYGLSDDKVSINALGQGTIYSVGGTFEMYLGARNLDITAGPNGIPAYPNAPGDIWNAADGALFLSANMVPGAVLTDNTTTYAQQVNSIANPLLGSGSGYLSITGGAYQWMFDNDGYLGGAADLRLQSNFNDYNAQYGWVAESFDPVRGTAVPEPASMILMAIGLAGAARLRRRTA